MYRQCTFIVRRPTSMDRCLICACGRSIAVHRRSIRMCGHLTRAYRRAMSTCRRLIQACRPPTRMYGDRVRVYRPSTRMCGDLVRVCGCSTQTNRGSIQAGGGSGAPVGPAGRYQIDRTCPYARIRSSFVTMTASRSRAVATMRWSAGSPWNGEGSLQLSTRIGRVNSTSASPGRATANSIH